MPSQELEPGALTWQGSALSLKYKGVWKVGRVGLPEVAWQFI